MTNDAAFRRGQYAAAQAIVDHYAALVERRRAAHAPQQLTEAIVAMARLIPSIPMPTSDPGPVDPDTPETPATPRPTTEMLLAVAALQAEESGLPISITIGSDGLLVQGQHAATAARSVRLVTWQEVLQGDSPALSLAVSRVADELRVS